ncbi:MAG: phenylacetate--CoA ligase family protein [Planctomycetota bacterium]
MNRWFVRSVLHPLHERLRGRPTCAFLRDFRRTESLDPAARDALIDRRLRDLVGHAVTRTPFWREWARREGFDVAAFRGRADLAALPVTDKAFIREHLEDLVAEDRRDRVFRLETGGSSGVPLIFYSDKEREASQLAAKARCREWWGVTTGDRQMDLWGSPIELGAQDRFRIWKDRLLNFRLLSAFHLSDEDMAGFRAAFRDHGTDYVYGYASVLDRYAAFLEQRGEDLHELGLKVAVTTAETLFPDQRDRIARVFGCGVANEYGCRDGGYLAQECPSGGLHLAVDTTHVEILDEDDRPRPDGEVGTVAVTNLWSFGFPVIRYKLGDRASRLPDPCPCGRSLPLLGELGGRVTDMLLTPDGNRVHGLGVIYVLRVLPGVDRFQVVQRELDEVVVRVVPREGARAEDLRPPIEAGVRQVLGPRVGVVVELVPEIPPLPSGKHRPIVSELETSR